MSTSHVEPLELRRLYAAVTPQATVSLQGQTIVIRCHVTKVAKQAYGTVAVVQTLTDGDPVTSTNSNVAVYVASMATLTSVPSGVIVPSAATFYFASAKVKHIRIVGTGRDDLLGMTPSTSVFTGTTVFPGTNAVTFVGTPPSLEIRAKGGADTLCGGALTSGLLASGKGPGDVIYADTAEGEMPKVRLSPGGSFVHGPAPASLLVKKS